MTDDERSTKMAQDNEAKAAEILAIGREAFGEDWAVRAEEQWTEVIFDVTESGLACRLCGAMLFEEYEAIHRGHHRLVTIGIWFAMTAAAARLAVEP